MKCAVILAALALQGCAIVEIRADDPKDVRLSLWPLGVHVTAEPGASDGVTVNAKTLGLTTGCGIAALGTTALDCTEIDSSVCGLAVVTDAAHADADLLETIAEETSASCHPKKGTTK